MVKFCANPNCGKPLRYLREGRIFVFESLENEGNGSIHRMEHYWLCGSCSLTYRLERTQEGIRTVTKRALREPVTGAIAHPLAS